MITAQIVGKREIMRLEEVKSKIVKDNIYLNVSIKEYLSFKKKNIELVNQIRAKVEDEILTNEVFANTLQTFRITETDMEDEDKQQLFKMIAESVCEFVQDKFNLQWSNLEGKIFLHVLSGIEDLFVKVAVAYLQNHCENIDSLSNDNNLIAYINNLDTKYLSQIEGKYSNEEKINKVRYEVSNYILKNGKIDLGNLETIKQNVGQLYDKNIFRNWKNNFNILFPFYYEQYKEKVSIELRKLESSILKIDEMKNLNLKSDNHIVGFEGTNNYGCSYCWMAIYPNSKKNHKESGQFFVRITSSEISYGFMLGYQLKEILDIEKDIENDNLSNFSFRKFKQKMISVTNIFEESNIPNTKHNKLNDSEIIEKTPPVITDNVEQEDNELDYQHLNVSFDKEFIINSLYFENAQMLQKQINTALKHRKHIILTGPPGTGKSKLAKEICRHYQVKYNMATAISEWSTFETIGGYRPDNEGNLYFDRGIFLQCLKDDREKFLNKWLIIDEMNRADIDKAFGTFFSVLTGDKISLSYKAKNGENIEIVPQNEADVENIKENEYIVHKDWRIIGTINTYDKSSLYEMSYAFMRRFAFIPVTVPRIITADIVQEYLSKWGIEDSSLNSINLAEGLSQIWKIINKYRVVGPAILRDVAQYVSDQGDYTSAIILYVLPQFEGIGESNLEKFLKDLYICDIKEFKKKSQVLKEFVQDFFGFIIAGDNNE